MKVAWPFTSVVPVPVNPAFGPAVTMKVTTLPEAGCPPSTTVAVTVCCVPVGLVSVSGARVMLLETKLFPLRKTHESRIRSEPSAIASFTWFVTPAFTVAVQVRTTVRPSACVLIAPPPSLRSLLR